MEKNIRAIPGENHAMVILLLELDLQCTLVTQSIERLKKSAEAIVNHIPGEGKPIDIISDCIVCLSAAASIGKMLQTGKRNGKKHVRTEGRCKALRKLLCYPALIHVDKLGTRNSWEHMDERLDEVFSSSKYTSFSPVHTSTRRPTLETFVHREFDPIDMKIRHGLDAVDLLDLQEECQDLREAINFSLITLQDEIRNPYSSADDV